MTKNYIPNTKKKQTKIHIDLKPIKNDSNLYKYSDLPLNSDIYFAPFFYIYFWYVHKFLWCFTIPISHYIFTHRKMSKKYYYSWKRRKIQFSFRERKEKQENIFALTYMLKIFQRKIRNFLHLYVKKYFFLLSFFSRNVKCFNVIWFCSKT